MVNTILAKRVNHIVAKGDNPAWLEGSKSRGFSMRNGAQHLDMGVANYQRGITLSFSYKFGGYTKKESKNVDTSRFGL